MAKEKLKNKTNTKQTYDEKDNYKKTTIAAILIVIMLAGAFIGYKLKNKEVNEPQNEYQATADEKEFKEEYESINGTTRSNGQINKEISIIEDNNIVYITIDEAADILQEESGVIYFGFAACPWCRNAVPVLLNAMASSNLDKIYYVNVRPNDDQTKDIREAYTAVKNKTQKTREASSERYDDVLDSLSDFLSDYTVVGENGKTIKTGKKVLGAPTVAVVKNGVVLDVHSGTVEGHNRTDGVLPDLTEEQTTELYNRYTSMITTYLEDGCTTDTTC